MRIPNSLTALTEEGIIDEVLRPLMSGKEAQVFLLRCGDEERVAKVYKDAEHRTFKQRAEYTEGRKVRNTRDQRALAKGSRYGREQDEATWRTTEVEMIQRLHAAGVRVPTPYHFLDGVLIMELVTDAEGNPAPRLGDVDFDRATALAIYDRLLREVVRMLCAGVVHGDLSDFNVLIDADGPVIIDFPQSVNAAGNQNARKLLLRDVDNLHRWLARFVPERQPLPYAEEMWQLYQSGELTPDVKLTGRFRASEKKVDTRDLLDFVADAERDESRRRQRLGLRGGPNPRVDVIARGGNTRAPDVARSDVNPRGGNTRAPDVARSDVHVRNNNNTRGHQVPRADAQARNTTTPTRGDANPRGFQQRADAHARGSQNHTQARGDNDPRRAGNNPNLGAASGRGAAPHPSRPVSVQTAQPRDATRHGPQHGSYTQPPARGPSNPPLDRTQPRRTDADPRNVQQSVARDRTPRQGVETVHRGNRNAPTQDATRDAGSNASQASTRFSGTGAATSGEAGAQSPLSKPRRRRRQRSRT